MTTSSDTSDFPIHFFTIVLNGEPYIRHHIEQMKKLSCRWHWHVVEGVAALRNDTAWSLPAGGRIPDVHHEGHSADGTTEYLNELAREYPNNVSIYRKQPNFMWDGKIEMINRPLQAIHEPCLLWEIDVDELWRTEQFEKSREMFLQHPEKEAAQYPCYFFVGPDRVATWGNVRGEHRQNWLRTWRFAPGMRWACHEPPVLIAHIGNNNWRNVAENRSFLEEETGAAGLVFQHFAYATLKQLQFKEFYYGYAGAVHRWDRLQAVEEFPVKLRDYFHWVLDETTVDKSAEFVPEPLIHLPPAPAVSRPFSIIWIRPDGVGDGVLASSMLPHVAAKYPGARITVMCREYISALYEKCPFVHEIIRFDYEKAFLDVDYRVRFIPRLRTLEADLCLHSLYSRDAASDFFAVNSGAKEIFALDGDMCNLDAETRAQLDPHYTRIIETPGAYKPELARHADFLKGLGIEASGLMPQFWSSPEDEEAAERIFVERKLDSKQTIALFAAALWTFKMYPSFGRALAKICRERSLAIVLMGSERELHFSEKAVADIGVPVVNLCGKLTLREGGEVLRKCRLAVGVDTGEAHIACAVGTPNVVVLGGGQFGRFFPYSPLTSAVSFPMACFGCNWKCKHERAHCVHDIQPEVLEVAIREALDSRSTRPRLYLQHANFGGLPPQTPPFFNPDILPAMVMDVTYVAPEGEPPFRVQPPSFSGNLLRVIQIPRQKPPVPPVMRVDGTTAQGGTIISFGAAPR